MIVYLLLNDKRLKVYLMIGSFRCKRTESLFNDATSKYFSSIQAVARRKLDMLNASTCLEDLRIPPSNHLELLKGDRKGQYSIRINNQFRLCFSWVDSNAENVEIVDYH